jgi:hypothetical protein|tara:strand:- start:720 stop:998 length:279 start_codon:yes stop_codon:yes gene_type:complete
LIAVKWKGGEKRWYSLSESAALVTRNKWGVPVDGIDSETLRRTYRDTKIGKRIGRNVFFTEQDLVRLGYTVDITRQTYVPLGDIVELIVEEN